MVNQLDIKFAKPQDVAQIVSLGYKSFDENLLEEFGAEPDFSKAMLEITDAVVNDAVLVKRNENDPELIDGVLAMKITYTWWSSKPILAPMLFFIKQPHRSFRTASAFLQAAKEYAIMNQIPIVFDLFAQKDVLKKKKLLKMHGFEEVGTTLIYRI